MHSLHRADTFPMFHIYIPWALSSFLKDKDLNQLTYQDKLFVEDLILLVGWAEDLI